MRSGSDSSHFRSACIVTSNCDLARKMMPNEPAMDDITAAIEGLTRRVHAYRAFESFKKGDLNMALELKGLRGKALKAAGHIDRLNHAYDAFNEAAPAHAADVEGLTPQITALQDDLAFAAQVLGNSVGASNAGAGESTAKITAAIDAALLLPVGSNASAATPEGAGDPLKPSLFSTEAEKLVKPSVLAEFGQKYDEAVDRVNKSTDRDIAEAGGEPSPTFRAAE